MSDTAHLQPGFDPKKLTVAQLRGILLQYDVPYSGLPKKTDLVSAFEKNIRPRAASILAEMGLVRPSDVGILDGESQDGSLAELDTDEGESREAESPAPKLTGKKGKGTKAKPRKSRLRPQSESDDESERLLSPAKAKPRKSRKSVSPAPPSIPTPVHDSADELSLALPTRGGRRSAQPSPHKRKASESPKIIESPLHEGSRRVSLKYESGGESGFSDFNPFQSGAEDTPDKKRRRKSSMGPIRQPSNLSTPAAGRKSMPAGLSAGRGWPSPDSPVVTSSPAVHSRLTGSKPAIPSPMGPNRVSPGTKFMVPVDRVNRKSSAEAQALQRQLAEYDSPEVEPEMGIEEFLQEEQEEDEDKVMEEAKTEEESEELIYDEEELLDLPELEELSPEPEPVSAPAPARSPARRQSYRESPVPQKIENLFRDSPNDRQVATRSPRSSSPVKGRRAGLGRRVSEVAAPVKDLALASPRKAVTASALLPPAWLQALVLGLTLLSSLFVWQDAKVAAGFCDPGTHTNALVAHRPPPALPLLHSIGLPKSAIELAEKANGALLRPSCTPCPAHGDCREGKFVTCDRDYVPREHPLRLSKLVPLAPSCVPDTEKLMVVATQASRAARILRLRRGDVICEGLEKVRLKQGKPTAWTYGVDAQTLVDALRAENKRSAAPFSDEVIEETARLAINDLEAHGEVLVDHEGEETWYAAQQAEMPLSCRARIAAIQQADKHKVPLGSFLAAVLTLLWGKYKLAAAREHRQLVKDLVQTALSELRKQHAAHYTDPVLTPHSHVAPSHLRDLVLQHEHSPKRRQELWKAVERVVEGNANVRSKQVEHQGEELRAWEWTGVGGAREMVQRGGERATVYPSLQ